MPSQPRGVLACSLAPGEQKNRQDELSELSRQAIARQSTADGVLLRFTASPEMNTRLHDVAAAEARCCPLLDISVHAAGEMLELRVSGASEAQPIIKLMFQSPDAA